MLPCSPGLMQSITSRSARTAETGYTMYQCQFGMLLRPGELYDSLPPPERAFPRRTISGRIPSCSYANILPVRHRPYNRPRVMISPTSNKGPKTTYSLDLIADEQNIMLLAKVLNLRKVSMRRDDDTCLTLDRLQEDRSGLFAV